MVYIKRKNMKKRKSKFSWDDSLPEDSHLPPELVREVLARLPVKTLLKFRCVCKTWCSIIDSSDFISLHYKIYNNNMNSSGNARLFAVQSLSDEYRITIRRGDTFREVGKLGRFRRFYILGSCNGLMLTEYGPCVDGEGYKATLKLWNPSIRKVLSFPHSPTWCSKGYGVKYILGFAPSSNDYKVLAIGKNVMDIALYSLSDRRWRVKTNQVNVEDCGLSWLKGCDTVFSGGAIYWVGFDRYKDEFKMDQRAPLFSFDFESEEIRSVQLPDAVKESMVWFTFPLYESIAVFTMSSENSCIWVLEKDSRDDPWRLCFSGDPNSDACKLLKSITNEYKLYELLKFLYVQKNNSFLMIQNIRETRKKKLLSYNLNDHNFQHLAKSLRRLISFDIYTEALALHKEIEAQTILTLSP